MKTLLDIVARHKRGEQAGVYSLCSAHPRVIESAMREARACNAPLLVEATSNQVNQFGGYTGMTPADFRRFVFDIANRVGFREERLWLGGDHLGPNAWQKEPADVALAKSAEMIRQYVVAGFRKIHLDCSMACVGDPEPLPEALIARRAARLCAVAENAWHEAGGEPPVYVIGTEVPVPGGATEDLGELQVTSPDAARATIRAHQDAFAEHGLEAAWSRVIALVVQPGVEFDHHKVIDYRPTKAEALSAFIARDSQFIFEAHSTDYQTATNLQALVRDHFAILKVGPGATYALRETLWALAAIAHELPGAAGEEDLRSVAIEVMRNDPRHWRNYYHDAARESLDLQFSLSDRIRYYWPHPRVKQAYEALLDRLRNVSLPLTLLSQFMPQQYEAVRAGRLSAHVDELLNEGIAAALRPYMRACGVPGSQE
ncbi:D-tagatose-bisphosphate aldolase, class II, non-catalytic subunit [Steroidobacter sp.]|uniref:D-tagatose-bisphosphate aldolase, class II, non-catalytic subunit n=1 Tax=Steroidobacter sp. TaxID=1978227 RepID=UPI001A569304|nr:D-tagatose-bisphosphate aldolase, class II, non-catalytic subunit [Steroidobacter sp.]MBL8271286.1 D-tagatose-bisphosphate aldolase, class II, non-catalytic subunit [Steroidobacter sp.]